MSIRYDLHMHSSFSTDSDAPMESMVQSAIEHNLEGICFTEHMDLDYPDFYFPEDPHAFVADPDSVYREILHMRELYSSQIQIGFGLEFGMQEHLSPRFHELSCRYPLDFIIASQHLVKSLDPYYPDTWSQTDPGELIELYYQEMLSNLKSMQEWDTLAHVDYIIRYIPKQHGQSAPIFDGVYDSLPRHKEVIDEILFHVIQSGKCLEINTAGYKYGLEQPHPAPSIIRRYRELGGELITIGADAHAPQHVAIGFDQVRELLLSMGFRSYCVFTDRKMRQIAL